MPVYFIQAGEHGPVKIGSAVNPFQRIHNLQTGCPERLRLLATCDGGEAEKRTLHERFSILRISGEWHTASDDLMAFIAEHCSPAPAPLSARSRASDVPLDAPTRGTIDFAIYRVRAFAQSKGWRKSRLAVEAGLIESSLRHFHTDKWNPTLRTIEALEALIPDDFTPGEAA